MLLFGRSQFFFVQFPLSFTFFIFFLFFPPISQSPYFLFCFFLLFPPLQFSHRVPDHNLLLFVSSRSVFLLYIHIFPLSFLPHISLFTVLALLIFPLILSDFFFYSRLFCYSLCKSCLVNRFYTLFLLFIHILPIFPYFLVITLIFPPCSCSLFVFSFSRPDLPYETAQ